MTGSRNTPDTKRPTRIRQDTVWANEEQESFMPQTTRPLPDRAVARRAHRLLISAGAALETLLADSPDSPEFSQQTHAEQTARAADALVELRDLPGRVDAAWSIDVPRREWAESTVEVAGYVYGWDLRGSSARDEVSWWADLLGATVVEETRASGAVTLRVEGHRSGVPVHMSFHLSATEAKAAAGGSL